MDFWRATLKRVMWKKAKKIIYKIYSINLHRTPLWRFDHKENIPASHRLLTPCSLLLQVACVPLRSRSPKCVYTPVMPLCEDKYKSTILFYVIILFYLENFGFILRNYFWWCLGEYMVCQELKPGGYVQDKCPASILIVTFEK